MKKFKHDTIKTFYFIEEDSCEITFATMQANMVDVVIKENWNIMDTIDGVAFNIKYIVIAINECGESYDFEVYAPSADYDKKFWNYVYPNDEFVSVKEKS